MMVQQLPAPEPLGSGFQSPVNRLGYMVQLDALRAIAVLGVVTEHYTPASVYGSLLAAWEPAFPLEWGSGVSLFFVISGFLITGILLRCRILIHSRGQGVGFTLRQFYLRRALRILPVYYLSLAVAALLFKKVRGDLLWHLSHTSNFLVFTQNQWDIYASHFWSLAIEEQFYLLWPLLILLLPLHRIEKVIWVLIGVAPLFRLVAYYLLGLSPIQIGVFPLASVDALGLGALLALYAQSPERFGVAHRRLSQLGLQVCLPLLVALTLGSSLLGGSVLLNALVRPTILAIFFAWLVDGASRGFSGLLGGLLQLKPLVWLGKISYGVYVYHYFMNPIFGHIFWVLYLAERVPFMAQFGLKLGATLVVATCSWFWLERPISRLKKHVGYEQPV